MRLRVALLVDIMILRIIYGNSTTFIFLLSWLILMTIFILLHPIRIRIDIHRYLSFTLTHRASASQIQKDLNWSLAHFYLAPPLFIYFSLFRILYSFLPLTVSATPFYRFNYCSFSWQRSGYKNTRIVIVAGSFPCYFKNIYIALLETKWRVDITTITHRHCFLLR